MVDAAKGSRKTLRNLKRVIQSQMVLTGSAVTKEGKTGASLPTN